ncbi:MAG: cytochrome b/b6 domain-containing protein, partial [Burkholderia vietnamiensis]|nr:cytochrome b/b6 domain-containing protein [Burkholderia vietnamiensis]
MKTATRYPLSISLLHWLLAVALTGNLIVGLLLDDNEDLVGLHKSIGVAILLLVALRLVNRLRARRRLPPSVNPAGTLRHSAERAVHG